VTTDLWMATALGAIAALVVQAVRHALARRRWRKRLDDAEPKAKDAVHYRARCQMAEASATTLEAACVRLEARLAAAAQELEECRRSRRNWRDRARRLAKRVHHLEAAADTKGA